MIRQLGESLSVPLSDRLENRFLRPLLPPAAPPLIRHSDELPWAAGLLESGAGRTMDRFRRPGVRAGSHPRLTLGTSSTDSDLESKSAVLAPLYQLVDPLVSSPRCRGARAKTVHNFGPPRGSVMAYGRGSDPAPGRDQFLASAKACQRARRRSRRGAPTTPHPMRLPWRQPRNGRRRAQFRRAAI